MKILNRIMFSLLITSMFSVASFSQEAKSTEEDENTESPRGERLRKIASGSAYDDMDINIDIDEEALEVSIESVEDVLENLDIEIAPIELNLGRLDMAIDPIVIPHVDINIDNDMDSDMDIDADIDDDDHHFNSDKEKHKDKIKSDKEKSDKSDKDKSDKEEKDKEKGLKKIN